MNELDIKVLNVKPAEIEFNYQDIIKELDSTLERYRDVIHTEETAPILRKDIATLRKGKQAINRFRIDEKNKMMIPIKEFEDKIKEIEKKFDEVEKPLSDQEKEFETKRRNDKLKVVEEIREKVFNENDLGDMPIEVIAIDNSYLTKSKTLTKIENEMNEQVAELIQSIASKKANEEIIKLTIDSVNAKHDLNMSITPYLSQLEMYDAESVKATINQDVETEIKRVEIANQRAQAESDAKARAERERLEKDKQIEIDRIAREKEAEEINAIISSNIADAPEVADALDDAEELNSYALSFMASETDFKQVKDLLDQLNISFMEL